MSLLGQRFGQKLVWEMGFGQNLVWKMGFISPTPQGMLVVIVQNQMGYNLHEKVTPLSLAFTLYAHPWFVILHSCFKNINTV